MKHGISIGLSIFLALLYLLVIAGQQGVQAAPAGGALWIEVTPSQMFAGDCNGNLSYGGGVGAYRLWSHDTIKLTQIPGQFLYRFCATVPGDYAFQVWDGSGKTVSARVKVLPQSSKTTLPPPGSRDILGSVWKVTEGDPNWTGTWTRRGGSNVFDAVWTGYGQRKTGVLTMAVDGAKVTITRGNDQYMGTINGKAASGSASWYGSGLRWTASIE